MKPIPSTSEPYLALGGGQSTVPSPEGRQTEDWRRHVFYAAPVAMLVLDAAGKIIGYNAHAEEAFGYDQKEILGRRADQLFPDPPGETGWSERQARLQGANRPATVARHRFMARGKNGIGFQAWIDLSSFDGDHGALTLVIVDAITERIETRLARAKGSRGDDPIVIAAAEDGIIRATPDGVITGWDAGAERHFGFTAEEAVGRALVELLVPEELRAPKRALLDEVRSRGVTKYWEGRRTHKDGRPVEVAVTLSPILDENDHVVSIAIVDRDLTSRKQQEERFRTVIEAMPTGVIIVTRKGLIDMVNAHTEKIFGYPREEMLGQPIERLIPEWPRPGHAAYGDFTFMAAEAQVLGAGHDLMARRKDDVEFPVEIGLRPFESDDGARVLALVTDISERVRADRVTAENHDELERSNRELSTFAFVASHDLKSPLRGISQLASWIDEDLRDGDHSQFPKYRELLQGRVRRMENLLDDLLAYSRVGRVEGAIGVVVVADMARGIFEMLSPPVGMVLELSPSLPTFRTLITPFEQTLRNLLSNAIKHHDRVTGVIKLECAPAERGFYRFSVIDDGPGIPPQYHERVFEMFQTLRPRDEVEGSGMGLALVKKLVESYGGTAAIRSNGSRGCAVEVTWPLAIRRISE